jgi:hypothetical protein
MITLNHIGAAIKIGGYLTNYRAFPLFGEVKEFDSFHDAINYCKEHCHAN